MKVVPLFPTPLCLIDFGEVHQNQDIQLVEAILRAYKSDPNGKQSSQVGGWHSNPLVDFDPAFEELCVLVKEAGQGFLSHMGYGNKIEDVNCWANINNKGQFNMFHHHNGSLLGGVYYPVKSLDDGVLSFNYGNDPVDAGAWGGHGGELVIQSPNYNLQGHLKTNLPSAWNTDHYHINPTSGLLVLFPAYLTHSVMPVMGDTTRISLAFSFL